MDISNNYTLLSRYLSSCLIVCFVVYFGYFTIKNHRVRGVTTTYSTAMCDISLEPEFNYLLYGILQVQIGRPKHHRQTFA